MEDHTSKNKKRVRDNSDDSAEVKRLREDLLGFSRQLGRRSHDSRPRLRHESFEEKIAAATNSCQSSPRPASDTEQESETDPASVPMVDLTSESGESNPDLRYLLEASDDELGLPPSENFSDETAKRRNPLQQLLCTEQTKQTPHPTPQSRHLCSPRARPTRPHTHTPHANRVQWNESVSICTWPGVICNGEHDCNNLSAKSVVSPTHFLLATRVWMSTVVMVVAVLSFGLGDCAAPVPAVDCSSLILNMADCLSFVSNGNTDTKLAETCCSGLKTVLKADASCLCETFKSSAQLGVVLNITKGTTLPAAKVNH
ncbi:hypothetical protein ACFX2F_021819 [Malus domestica]